MTTLQRKGWELSIHVVFVNSKFFYLIKPFLLFVNSESLNCTALSSWSLHQKKFNRGAGNKLITCLFIGNKCLPGVIYTDSFKQLTTERAGISYQWDHFSLDSVVSPLNKIQHFQIPFRLESVLNQSGTLKRDTGAVMSPLTQDFFLSGVGAWYLIVSSSDLELYIRQWRPS